MQKISNSVFNLLLVLAILATPACKTMHHTSGDQFPRIELSEGGGFTGALAIYRLYPDGAVFFRDMSDTAFRKLNPISHRKAGRIFKEVKSAVTGGETIYEPDNIYRSISYITKDSMYTALWYSKRPEMDSLYNQIMYRINEQNGTNK